MKIFAIVTGILTAILGWQGIFNILIAIGGGIILFNTFSRVMTDMFLAYLAGFVIIVYGVNMLLTAIKNWKESTSMAIVGIICALFSIVAGGFSIMHPVLTMISLGYIIGFSVIMQGVNMIVLACSVKTA